MRSDEASAGLRSRVSSSVLGRLESLHSETLSFLRFHHILLIFVSDLLSSFNLVLVIDFLDDASSTVQLIIAALVVVYQSRLFTYFSGV